jgi:catechol 2,3-dioxygenase-like lactoylglutathione lyase family enzyme
MADWFARPVLHVKDVDASLRFYMNRLGFTSRWRYDEDGRAYVAQVDRQGCALILADTWPEKVGKGLMFISLNVEPEASETATREAAIAALDALRAEFEAKGVPVKEGSWGYRLLVVDDPDGNQLFFNYPNETASGNIARYEAYHRGSPCQGARRLVTLPPRPSSSIILALVASLFETDCPVRQNLLTSGAPGRYR